MLKKIIKTSQVKSPWLVHYDCGSCNGCDIETLACLTPLYDVERFGVLNIGNPKHADVLIVTGTVNKRNKKVLKQIYEQMPSPKIVIAVGACGLSGGIFREAYNVVGGVDKVIPVDVYVPGCPAKPEAIIDGVVEGLAKLKDLQQSSQANALAG
ncbi:MAG: NADH-quinone oxidoreductase subunit B family protein [Desulfobacterales bacterium]|nr:NADH-quinone oxidoreductase subunit B family protein [Desulfobacterales bacterium]